MWLVCAFLMALCHQNMLVEACRNPKLEQLGKGPGALHGSTVSMEEAKKMVRFVNGKCKCDTTLFIVSIRREST